MDPSFLVSLLAVAVSIAAFVYSRRATSAAEAQAQVAQDADRRAREPRLTVEVKTAAREGESRVWIEVTNHGPGDLDRVVVRRPATEDGVRYPVAPLGGDFDDEADLGALPLLEKREFALSIGTALNPPRFVVRTTSFAPHDQWEQAFVLGETRFVVPKIVTSNDV